MEWEIIFSKVSQMKTNMIFPSHVWNSSIYECDKKVEKVLAGGGRAKEKT